jgi:hypothetical protein
MRRQCQIIQRREEQGSGTRLNLVDVGLPWAFVDGREKGIDLIVFGKPCGHLAEFFTQAVDSLVVHVCLCNQLGHGNCMHIRISNGCIVNSRLTKKAQQVLAAINIG